MNTTQAATQIDWIAVLTAIGTILTAVGNILASRRHQATMQTHVDEVRKVSASVTPPPGDKAA